MTSSAFWLAADRLILASGSSARRDMLEAAGIPVETKLSGVDERTVEAPLLERGAPPREVASALAFAKAAAVSAGLPNRVVLGSDQLLTCDGETLHKPSGRSEARIRLTQLSGRTHQLHSAFVLIKDGVILAEGVDTADLAVRALTPAFIEAYLGALDDTMSGGVGVYRVEELGAQLFQSVDGDHFTIMGMPLLAVLEALRGQDLLLR